MDNTDTINRRPGGRSARVQQAVYNAVRTLQQQCDKTDLSIPAIATLAGVTPSTIYRRWGNLNQLLADVAVEKLLPEMHLPDSGSLRTDLQQWLELYVEEMSSEPGQQMLRDILAGGPDNPCRCSDFTRRTLDTLCAQARQRGEPAPPVERLINHVLAPVLYRLLFQRQNVSTAFALQLLEEELQRHPDH